MNRRSIDTGQRPGTTRTLLAEGDGGVVRRTVLTGGLRVVTEQLPHVRSVTFGVWVGVGSRDETPRLSGATHYLEHLLFKGTRRRNALQISAALDAVGGEMNAFTDKEFTCYYAQVLDADLPLAVDIVCDMVTSSLIASGEVENERGVIYEEIAMNDDDPSEAVHDLFAEQLWGKGPLGRPIPGTLDTVQALSRTQIAGYYRRRYLPERMVVAAAGNVDHAALVKLVRRAFVDAAETTGADQPAPPRIGGAAPTTYSGGVSVLERPTEQANVVLGMPALARTDERRFAFSVLNAALGGSMSSRLFQQVREKRGLAYTVQSFTAAYSDGGLFGVYAGCVPGKVDEVLGLCREEIAEAAAHGITEEELERGKGQLRGGLVLGLEDSGSRMSRLGKAELVYGELLSLDALLGRIEAVTIDDVAALATELLTQSPALAVIGPFDDPDRFAPAVA